MKDQISGQTIVEFGNNGRDNINFSINNEIRGSLQGYIVKGSTSYQMNTHVVIPNPNRWYHVAFTLSGNIGSIYVDGVLSSNQTLSSINGVTRLVNYIGDSKDAYYDEIKIYKGVMSAASVLNDFNNSYSGKSYF